MCFKTRRVKTQDFTVLGIHNFGFSLAPFYWLTPPFGSFAIGNSGTTAPCCKNGHNSIVANIIAYLSMPISAVFFYKKRLDWHQSIFPVNIFIYP